MNLLYVHNVGKIGGAERVTLDIINGLDRNEHSAFLVTPEDGPFCEAAREAGASATVLPICQPDIRKPFATYASNRTWLSYLKKHRIDLIHTGDLFVTRTLIRAANKLGIPLVCHVHFPVDAPALNWIFRKKPRRCHFVYCSQELHDTVAPRVNPLLRTSEHHVIHNGVDIEKFKSYSPPKGLLTRERINIGIIANLQERKGHTDLIEAAAELVPENPNLLFHIIGGDIFGESRESLLRKKIEDLDLTKAFVFHGQITNVRDYLNELDIIVCASREEAFPISILEAMAFGKAIVSTDVNGIPEAITNNKNGLLVPPFSPVAIKEKLELLISKKRLSLEMGAAARREVELKFGINIFRLKIYDLYKNRVGTGG